MALGFESMADWLWYCLQEFDREDLTLIYYGTRWIRASCAEGCSSSVEAEGNALLMGFKKAEQRGLNRVTFATDSAEVCLPILDGGNRDLKAEEWRFECQKRMNSFAGLECGACA
ncbi:hypothetical protein QQ045_005798 [Rhodiola kirilowii]